MTAFDNYTEIRTLSADASLTCQACGKTIYPLLKKPDGYELLYHDEWSIDIHYRRHWKTCIDMIRKEKSLTKPGQTTLV